MKYHKHEQKYLTYNEWSTLTKLRSGHIEIEYYYIIKYNNKNYNKYCNQCMEINNLSHILFNCTKFIDKIHNRENQIQKIYFKTNINELKFDYKTEFDGIYNNNHEVEFSYNQYL